MQKGLMALLIIGLMGCGDFLEETSQDEVRPSTVDDLMQVMVGDAFPMDYMQYNYIDFFTDDVQCNGASGEEVMVSSVEDKYAMFLWRDEMFEDNVDEKYNSWAKYYGKIMGCNTVLDYVDKVTGDEKTKENMRGQALVLRGFYYFMLVNYYGLPYNYGNPEENLGVPLKLKLEVTDEYMRRNTVAEVYEQVIKDVEDGIKLIEENPMKMSLYKIDALAGKAILCRVYLYMEEWDKALEYANMVLEEKPNLTSLASAPEDAIQYQGSSRWCVYNETESDEIIWMYSSVRELACYPDGGTAIAPYTVSDELIDLYEFSTDADNHGDLRYYMYFSWKGFLDMTTFIPTIYPAYGFKGGHLSNSPYATQGIRTAEIYLNRAECYIRKYMESGDDNYRKLALADLNKLRESRYDTRNVAYVDVDKTTAEDLFAFYKEERRRELCFEGHRWFDLRRYGMPELTHVYFVEEGQEEVETLSEGDLRYVLPIPRVVLERNPGLQQNER